MEATPRDLPPRPTLLVVDDEEDLLQIFAEFLDESEYDLDLARTGLEAVEKLQKRSYDLVVTDLNLPGADGLAVLRQAKESDPQTEVIVLTGNASVLTAIEAMRQGAYDYVLKPFELYDVDQTIRKALERRRLLAENRRFVENLQRMVEDATLRIRSLYEISREITSSLHLEQTLSLILERSLGLTGGVQGALFLLSEPNGSLECRVSRGQAGEPVSGQLLTDLAATNERVLSTCLPVVESVGAGDSVRVGLVVPLLQENQVSGTVAVLAGPERDFTADDRELLVSLAASASNAIHNAKVYEKIRDLERLKSEFVAVVSHEVRTPLTSIKGTLELLADDRYLPVQEQQRSLFDICQTNVERLEALINDILDFSKLESSRLSTNLSETAIASLLDSVVVNIVNQAERKQIRIVREIEPALPLLQADQLRIIQVLNNLLSNAIKFSPPGSEIRVCARALDGGIEVAIKDQGIGIASEDLPKLFTRFRQLDSSSTRKSGGTGLGLTISKGIVEEHGGRIWVDSVLEKGSCFSFWLPNQGTLPAASLTPCREVVRASELPRAGVPESVRSKDPACATDPV